MSLMDTLLRVASHQPTEFVAPMLDADETVVLIMQDEVPYRVSVFSAPGWHLYRPRRRGNGWIGLQQRAATPDEYLSFMSALNGFYVITLFPVSDTAWMCIPYNAGDAEQRGWPGGMPRRLHIVRHRLQPVQIVRAVALGDQMVYERIDMRLPYYSGDAESASLIYEEWARERQRVALEAQLVAARQARIATVEDTFRYQLEYSGATLVGLENHQWADSYRVKWEYNGKTHEVIVDRKGRLMSAGFCVAGTDSLHNLTTAVGLVDEAYRRGRPDVGRYRDEDDWEEDYDY